MSHALAIYNATNEFSDGGLDLALQFSAVLCSARLMFTPLRGVYRYSMACIDC